MIGYDKVSANAASSEPKTSKFQSGHRVVRRVQTPDNIYIYDKQSDIMHKNHPKHSNFENHRVRFIILAPNLGNYQK